MHERIATFRDIDEPRPLLSADDTGTAAHERRLRWAGVGFCLLLLLAEAPFIIDGLGSARREHAARFAEAAASARKDAPPIARSTTPGAAPSAAKGRLQP